jgi:DNA-binding NtrC family response regulator
MSDPVRVLIVDDEERLRRFIGRELASRGMVVEEAGSGEAALARLTEAEFDVVLLDVRMPGMDGLTALGKIRAQERSPEVLILTGQGSIDSAVAAMRAGAFHYLTKPFHMGGLAALIEKACERAKLVRRTLAFERIQADHHPELIGESPAIQRVKDLIDRVAGADTAVVIEGESGTGKEIVAHAIHAGSPRARGPFVAVNCAALSESLLESELFGHEKGSFTGAIRAREGLAEVADAGTLFLDEVGELQPPLQAALLRFLESGEIRRVGASRNRHVDVRVIAATNRRLDEIVKEGRFREDLFYRLRVFALPVPPLRERSGDIPLLADHFLRTLRGAGRGPFSFAADARRALTAYPWPGNVRELRNAIERTMLLADSGEITLDCLPPELVSFRGSSGTGGDELNLAEIERRTIERALRECGGHRAEAAKRLGISVRTLYNRLGTYGDGLPDGAE